MAAWLLFAQQKQVKEKNKENVKFVPITFRPRQGGVNSINLKRIFKIGIQAVKDFRVIKKTI